MKRIKINYTVVLTLDQIKDIVAKEVGKEVIGTVVSIVHSGSQRDGHDELESIKFTLSDSNAIN